MSTKINKRYVFDINSYNRITNNFYKISKNTLNKIGEKDSKWPVFFPSNIGILSFKNENKVFIERVTSTTIINRFPLILSISIPSKRLSKRHLNKKIIIENLTHSGRIYLSLMDDKNLKTIKFENEYRNKIIDSSLELLNKQNFLKNSYLSINLKYLKKVPYKSSHTILLFEVDKIYINQKSLKKNICWKPLPNLKKNLNFLYENDKKDNQRIKNFKNNYKYRFNLKNPNYLRIVKHKNFYEVFLKKIDLSKKTLNDEQAKWPFFFPTSLGIISSIDKSNNQFNVMPCGSTHIISRAPFSIGIAISKLQYNNRYKLRSSLLNISNNNKFVCSVPFASKDLIKFINYSGNVSAFDNVDKISSIKLNTLKCKYGLLFRELPFNYLCKVRKIVKLKSHSYIIASVEETWIPIQFRKNSLIWQPTASIK